MRVGAFCFTSSDAFLMENLICPAKLPKEETMQNMLNAHGSCYLRNIKTGVWIAYLQLVRCCVCELNTCDGKKKCDKHRLVRRVGYLNLKWTKFRRMYGKKIDFGFLKLV